MKTKIWFIAIMIFAGLSLQAQEAKNKMYDPDKNQEILIGYCNRSDLNDVGFGEYMTEEYENYNADPDIIKQIGNHITNLDIVIVLGTWCHDSKEQVPRFYRVLDDAGFPDDPITLIAVDGKKTGGKLDISHLGIELVPTFIFYRKGEEIGRIVETPEVSLEADMLSIIR
jgi:thiol-disulfide isomerase/thioredoxin